MRVNIRDTRVENFIIAARAAQIFLKPEHSKERYLFLVFANGEDEEYYRAYCWRGVAPVTTITVRVDAKGEDCTQKGAKPDPLVEEVPLIPK